MAQRHPFRLLPFFCIAVLFFLLPGSILNAQPVDPPTTCDSCPGDSYSASTQSTFVLDTAAGCSVTVSYRTRICHGVYELKIDTISVGSGCSGIKIEDFVNASIAKFVLYNKMSFPPNSLDTGHKVWRVLRQSCWKYVGSLLHSDIIDKAVACTGDCCISMFDVYRNERCDGLSMQDRKQKSKADCHTCNDDPPPINVCCPTCIKDLLHYHFER